MLTQSNRCWQLTQSNRRPEHYPYLSRLLLQHYPYLFEFFLEQYPYLFEFFLEHYPYLSGFFLTLNNIPVYMQWLSYVAYVRYGFEGTMMVGINYL